MVYLHSHPSHTCVHASSFTDSGAEHKVTVDRSGGLGDLLWPPKAPQASQFLATSPNNQSPLTQTPSTSQSFPLLQASTSPASQIASVSPSGPAAPSSSATRAVATVQPHVTSSSNEYKTSHILSVLVGDAHSRFRFSLYNRTATSATSGSGKSSPRAVPQGDPKEMVEPVRAELPGSLPKVPNVQHQSVTIEDSSV